MSKAELKAVDNAQAGLYRIFLDRLKYPSTAISTRKNSWLWMLDNPLLNGEEALALAVAKNQGITFPFLPDHTQKNVALGSEEIRRRLHDDYTIAKEHKLFPRKFDPDKQLDAFVVAAEQVTKEFDARLELRAMTRPSGKRGRSNPFVV